MQSSLKPKPCLQWDFQRPCSDGERTSSYFSMLGDQWCLRIALKLGRGESKMKSDCSVYLLSRSGKKPSDGSLIVTCSFMAREKFHGYSHRSTFMSEKQTIFHTDLNNADIYPKKEDEKWTVYCMFSCNNPLLLKVGNESIHLSTADERNVPPVDEGAQVSTRIPVKTEALMSTDMSSLLEEETFPDFQLKCGGRIFPVHRCILAARCRVFRDLFGKARREGELGSVDIHDLEAPALYLLLKCLYSGKLEAEDRAASLYEVANKYGVRFLSAACSDSMKRNLTLENCVGHLQVSISHSDLGLKEAAVSFILSHPSVFKSAAWAIFLNNHVKVAADVLQTYAAKSRKRDRSVKEEPSTSKTRKIQSSSHR